MRPSTQKFDTVVAAVAIAAAVVLLAAIPSTAAMSSLHSTVADCLAQHYYNASSISSSSTPGSLFTAGSAEYNATLVIPNKRTINFPAAVVSPASETDVVNAMTAAELCNVTFTVISGGHSAEGYGLAKGGITVNMRSLNSSSFSTLSDGTPVVTVGAGSRFLELYKTLRQRNKMEMVVGGGCAQVGLGGFTLGGGWSLISRQYGLAIDNLIDARLILPNKTIVTMSAEHPDTALWWALRGGGGGNFGIVTHFTEKLHVLERQSSIGDMCWGAAASSQIMQWWILNFGKMPRTLDLVPSWVPIGPGGTHMFCLTVVCNAKVEDCSPWVDALRSGKVAAKPIFDLVKVQPLVDFLIAPPPPGEFQQYQKTFTFTRANFSMATVDTILSVLNASIASTIIDFHVGGGAIGDVAANATAFPHRDSMLLMQVLVMWKAPVDPKKIFAWMDQIVAGGFANTSSGAYVNFIDGRLVGWQEAYYGKAGGYERLVEVKRRVDPTNLFRFRQSIGSK